jgi:predicted nucleic acid-binding protein
MVYPDTSFLCSIYVPQRHSATAISYMEKLEAPLGSSSLLFFEFRQSIQFQVFRHAKDKNQGYPLTTAQIALAAFQSDVKVGLYQHAAVDWADVHRVAERLAFQYTLKNGHRSFDILHVATALHIGAREFLTFDVNQKRLVEAEGLVVPF